MTIEKAVKYLEVWRECYRNSIDSCTAQAIGMAIEALNGADGIRDAIIEAHDAPTIDIEERLNDAYAKGWSDAEAKYHDAVEVVRCGQCKHRVFAEYNGVFHLLCERIDGVEVRPNDYCSYGERRESDERG